MQETWVRSLSREDPLEKETPTHSSILAWEIPWTEEPGRLQSMGLQRVGHDWVTKQQSIPILIISPKLTTHPISLFPLWCPYICSLCLCLCFCLANRFICNIHIWRDTNIQSITPQGGSCFKKSI